MIQSNELRLGNWVLFDTDNGFIELQIESIRSEVISSGFQIAYYDDEDNGLPIPISEEWLLKFEFEHDVICEIHDRHNMCLSYSDQYVGYKLFVNHEYEVGKAMLYVHQLQNLYFALTGEELEVKS